MFVLCLQKYLSDLHFMRHSRKSKEQIFSTGLKTDLNELLREDHGTYPRDKDMNWLLEIHFKVSATSYLKASFIHNSEAIPPPEGTASPI